MRLIIWGRLFIIFRQVQEKDALADTIVAARKFLVAIEIETEPQPATFFHLRLGQTANRLTISCWWG